MRCKVFRRENKYVKIHTNNSKHFSTELRYHLRAQIHEFIIVKIIQMFIIRITPLLQRPYISLCSSFYIINTVDLLKNPGFTIIKTLNTYRPAVCVFYVIQLFTKTTKMKVWQRITVIERY